MKKITTAAILLATAAPAIAHETGVAHHHPHVDPAALVALGLIVVAGGYTLWRARQAAVSKTINKRDKRS